MRGGADFFAGFFLGRRGADRQVDRAMPASFSPSPRASLWEWAQVALIAGNLAWTTLCLGGYRPETMIVTSALNALLLAVHFVARSLGYGAEERIHPAGWWLLPFLGYALVNVLWLTPVPWLGWKDWLGWVQMVLVFWVVLNGVRSTSTRTALFAVLAALAFVTVVLACYQRFVKPDWLMMGRTQADQFVGRASGSFGIPNSLAALLLLMIPPLTALTLRRRSGAVTRVLAGYLVLAFTFGLVLTISRGALIALALVLIAWPVLASRGSLLRKFGWGALALAGVGAALAAMYFGMPKVRERIVQMKNDAGERTRPIMWRGAWQIFREHPTWGGGAGSYNVLFEKFRPKNYQDEPVWAHNDYLNTLSDYGAVGFVLFFGVGAGLIWRCARSREPRARDWLDEPKVAGALMAGAVAFVLQLFVDFHFKIPALAMAFAIIAALIVQRAWPARPVADRSSGARRAGGWMVALAAVGATAMWVTPFYRAEAIRYSARQAVNRLAVTSPTPAEQRATLEQARADFRRAVEIEPSNAQAWSDLSYSIALWAHVESGRTAELGREAEQAAAKALALSNVASEFWLRRGVALDMQGRQSEAGAAFVQALLLAPADGRTWFYQAFHLSLNKSDLGLALAAVDFCLRLDPGNREAQLLRQRLVSARRTP